MITAKTSWVVAGGAVEESAHCQRCGAGLVLGAQPVSVWIAAVNAFADLHSDCQQTWSEPVPKTPLEWARGRDVGVSSFTIWAAATGQPSPLPLYGVPHDPADFGRCYRLIRRFPEMLEGVSKAVKYSPKWKGFDAAWEELTALYEEELLTEKAPRLYARLQELNA